MPTSQAVEAVFTRDFLQLLSISVLAALLSKDTPQPVNSASVVPEAIVKFPASQIYQVLEIRAKLIANHESFVDASFDGHSIEKENNSPKRK
jgi:hypothetical protein